MITNQTTVSEFLQSDADIDLLFDLLIAYNAYDSKDLVLQPFQNVMDIVASLNSNDVVNAVSMASGIKRKKLLKSNSNDFLQYLKWLIEQSKIINNLFSSLSVDSYDEDAMMLQASGVDKLNRYNEIMIYYNIDKNPTTWDSIGKMSFSTIFTKLSIDKDISEIQKNYNQMIKRKNK